MGRARLFHFVSARSSSARSEFGKSVFGKRSRIIKVIGVVRFTSRREVLAATYTYEVRVSHCLPRDNAARACNAKRADQQKTTHKSQHALLPHPKRKHSPSNTKKCTTNEQKPGDRSPKRSLAFNPRENPVPGGGVLFRWPTRQRRCSNSKPGYRIV